MITAFLSIGSSQEFIKISGNNKTTTLNSQEILELACDEIKKLSSNSESFLISSFIESEPWGGVAKNIFVNAVCRLEISLEKYPEGSEEKFLDILQKIEKKFGRIRNKNSENWADRTLDIDILYWGEKVIARPRLTIPHPFIWEREFVFQPLREICSEEELRILSDMGL